MFCNKCGKELGPNSSFCPNCGNNININTNINQNSNVVNNGFNNVNYGYNTINNNGYNNLTNGYMNNINNMNLNTNKKKVNPILILLGVVIVLLVLIIILVLGKKENVTEDDILDSRTILIYLCGSDLESKIGLASYDLESIDPSKIDLETTNIVVYTGGAKTWHNYVSNEENAIYVLEESGFVKKESYERKSMGKTESFSTLLEYTYENYKADKYDLIMWNHGLGALGISSDEIYFSDHLNLNELSAALEKSSFKGDNKFETVVFRSCLNSTLEMANIFVPYAKYFVASEEVTWGGQGSNLLSFLNEVTLEDSGVEFGKKFIASYEGTLNALAAKGNSTLDQMFPVSTYSILDLSKIDNLENKLNIFFKDLNLDLNYYTIAKIRSNLHQYASETGSNDFDTVDLYNLVEELKVISSSKADSVLKALDETIVYNWSNNDYSYGLAIYFPYRSSAIAREMHYEGYKNLNELSDYYKFIQKFDSIQAKATAGDGFSVVAKDEVKVEVADKKATLEIENDNVEEFAKASYIIFNKNADNTYTPVFVSDTFELAKNTYTVDLDVDLIKAINKKDNTSKLLTIYRNDFNNYYTNTILEDDEGSYTANIYFNTDNNISILKVLMSSEEAAKGMFLDINEYKNISFLSNKYKLFSNNQVNNNWEKDYNEDNFNVSDYAFEKEAVDNNYYVMFKIYDIDNLYVYSDLVQIK